MALIVLGINHKTAPISVREKVTFSPDMFDSALASLHQQSLVRGGVILSTCNRTEIYLSAESIEVKSVLLNWLCDYHQLNQSNIIDSVYWHQETSVIAHLMRVACGLDSLIIGEPQILGQVKKAFFDAQRYQNQPIELERLFQKCFSAAKRVRTETEIGASAVSIAFAATTLARQIFESLSSLSVLLIGAGETIELVARYLREQQVQTMIIANRTVARAQALASEMQAEVISLPEIAERLYQADIVISSTASPLPIVGKGMVERALKRRRYQPMLFIDIAVPRDIEQEVGDINSVYLYSVDDLHSIIERNLEQRKLAAEQAELIIQQECEEFADWLRAQDAVSTIRDYRQFATNISTELTDRALQTLAQGIDPQIVVQELAHKLTNRLIHAPTKSLQQAASSGDSERLQLLRQSLGLGNKH